MFGIDLPLWALAAIAGGRKFLAALWAFVTKPPGSYIALVMLIGLAWWWSGEIGHNRGEKQGRADCEAAHTAAATKEVTRQEKAVTAAVVASEKRTTRSAVLNTANREIVADAKARAEDLPPPPPECPAAVPADIADRLRGLR
jgi:hypothetical protein